MHMFTPQITQAVLVGGSSNVSHPVQCSIGMIGARQIIQKSPAKLFVSAVYNCDCVPKQLIHSIESPEFHFTGMKSNTHPKRSCESALSSSPTLTFMYTT